MKKIVSGLLAAALAMLLALPARAGSLAVEAEACLLMEKTTGQILYAVNEHQQLEPASVTKIMTILLVMEAIDSGALAYDDMVAASAYACFLFPRFPVFSGPCFYDYAGRENQMTIPANFALHSGKKSAIIASLQNAGLVHR